MRNARWENNGTPVGTPGIGPGYAAPRSTGRLLGCPCFAAVRESAFDAVDGSSTGTEVQRMWVLLRPPRFGGAKHASGHDNWSRYR